MFVDLPVGLSDPKERLTAIRGQMDEYKRAMSAVDANLDVDSAVLERMAS